MKAKFLSFLIFFKMLLLSPFKFVYGKILSSLYFMASVFVSLALKTAKFLVDKGYSRVKPIEPIKFPDEPTIFTTEYKSKGSGPKNDVSKLNGNGSVRMPGSLMKSEDSKLVWGGNPYQNESATNFTIREINNNINKKQLEIDNLLNLTDGYQLQLPLIDGYMNLDSLKLKALKADLDGLNKKLVFMKRATNYKDHFEPLSDVENKENDAIENAKELYKKSLPTTSIEIKTSSYKEMADKLKEYADLIELDKDTDNKNINNLCDCRSRPCICKQAVRPFTSFKTPQTRNVAKETLKLLNDYLDKNSNELTQEDSVKSNEEIMDVKPFVKSDLELMSKELDTYANLLNNDETARFKELALKLKEYANSLDKDNK